MIESDRINEILDGLHPDENGCKIWPNPPRAGGYATGWVGGKEVRMNRYVLMRKLGRSILPGMLALHSCDNRMCVASEHIREGTPKENTQDMFDRGRSGYQRGTPPPHVPGSRCGHAKLSEEQVVQIRKRHKDGERVTDLALEFGVSQQSVTGITKRWTWKHVD